MPKIKGPANGELFAKFDGKAKIDTTSKKPKNTKDEKCLVLISVQGNDFCNQEFVEAAIKTGNSEFSQTTFLIVDDPQCYNLAANDSLKNNTALDARDKLNEARALGEQWWRQNENFILKFLPESQRELCDDKHCPDVNSKIKTFNELARKNNLKINFIRWQDWINQSTLADNQLFESYRKKFDTEATLSEGRTKTAEKFSSRKTKKNNSASIQINDNHQVHDVFLNYSQQFLTDESIGVMVSGKEKEYHYVAYAGDQIDILKAAHTHFVGNDSNLLGWLSINFEKRLVNAVAQDPTNNSQTSGHKTQIAGLVTPPDLINKNLCIHIVPFQEKEDQDSYVKKIGAPFKAKCLNDKEIQAKNIILVEDSLKPFEVAITDKEYQLSPKFHKRHAAEVYNNWCASHPDIIKKYGKTQFEHLSYTDIKEHYKDTYSNILYEIEDKIQTSAAFKKAFDQSALGYLNEIKKKNSHDAIIEEKKAIEYALAAVKEKCAVLMTIAIEKKLNYINQPIAEKEAFEACKVIFSDRIYLLCIDSAFNVLPEPTSNLKYPNDINPLDTMGYSDWNPDYLAELSDALKDKEFYPDEESQSPRSNAIESAESSLDASLDEESSTSSSSSEQLRTRSQSSSPIRSALASSSESETDSNFFELKKRVDSDKNQSSADKAKNRMSPTREHVKNKRLKPLDKKGVIQTHLTFFQSTTAHTTTSSVSTTPSSIPKSNSSPELKGKFSNSSSSVGFYKTPKSSPQLPVSNSNNAIQAEQKPENNTGCSI